jgi:GNAT superfamily N-acetyltransferase
MPKRTRRNLKVRKAKRRSQTHRQKGCGINDALNNDGRTLLYNAARDNNLAKVEELVDAGADINKATTNIGATPLFIACQQGHINIVKILLSVQSIDVNKARTDNGMTPLYIACAKGHVKVVEMLLSVPDIDINKARTDNGMTPLYAAMDLPSTANNIEMVKSILRNENIHIDPWTTRYSRYYPSLEVSRALTHKIKSISNEEYQLLLIPSNTFFKRIQTSDAEMRSKYMNIAMIKPTKTNVINIIKSFLKCIDNRHVQVNYAVDCFEENAKTKLLFEAKDGILDGLCVFHFGEGRTDLENDSGFPVDDFNNTVYIDIMCGSDRKSGMGTYIMNHIIELAKGSGIQYIEVDSIPEAVGFYKKQGFVIKEGIECNDDNVCKMQKAIG